MKDSQTPGNQTALEVRPDGIYLIENLPEEPNRKDFELSGRYMEAVESYGLALTSAKQSAIRVEDQEQAKRILYEHMGFEMGPGVYPISGLQWEEQWLSKNGHKVEGHGETKVAVLSPSSIETTENMKTGIELITEERREQIEKHGFDLEKDAEFYQQNELYNAAMYVLTMDKQYYPATWDFWFHDKLKAKEQRMSEQEFWVERMKIAGALLAADIDMTLKDNV